MSGFQPFNASNEPGTCLWCGRKLRRPTLVTYGEPHYPKRSKCCNAKLEQDSLDDRIIFDGDNVPVMCCSKCGGFPGRVYPIASKEYRYDKPGDYGDGYFCGLSCGYRFGRAMANHGRSLRSAVDGSRAPSRPPRLTY